MEHFETGTKDLLSNDTLQMQEPGASNFKVAGSWAKSIGIVCVIVIGIMLLGILAALVLDDSSSRLAYIIGGDYIAIVIVLILIMLGIFTVYAINLIRFGTSISAAVQNTDNKALEKSFVSLKYYFIISGIVSILGLLYAILTLFK